MATNVFASRYTARQVEEALEKAMSAVQSINGQTPGVGGDVFVEALKLQKGDPASVDETVVSYAASPSGRDIPAGAWSETVPVVPQGEYLWTRVTVVFNSGEPVVFYSVSRMGMDGHGSVAAVNGISPDSRGNVVLTAGQVGARPDTWLPTAQEVGARPDTWIPTAAEVGARPDSWTPSAADVGALPASGGKMTGGLDMAGQPLTGLAAPGANADAANKAYVDNSRRAVNLLDNSDFTKPVAQTGVGGKHGNVAYAADRWILTSGTVSVEEGVGMTLNGAIVQKLENPPAGTVSAFVGMASGTASISYAEGEVTVTSAGGTLKWAALYEGEYTAETLPPYVPKGYAAELLECQRYYLPFANSPLGGGYSQMAGGRLLILVPTAVTMRRTPSLTVTTGYVIRGGGKSYDNGSAAVSACFSNGVVLTVTKSGVPGNYAFSVYNDTAGLALSADL